MSEHLDLLYLPDTASIWNPHDLRYTQCKYSPSSCQMWAPLDASCF